FSRWAPTPSRAPAATIHTGGHRGSGRARVITAGSAPNAIADGRPDQATRLRPRLYAQPDPTTSSRCTAADARPQARDKTTHAPAAIAIIRRTRTSETSPRATGLSARPTCRSRPASITSLDQPIVSCPAATAAVTTKPVPNPWPTATAKSAVSAVTATVGPGWLARSRAGRVDGVGTGRA